MAGAGGVMVGARRAARSDFLESSLIDRLYESSTTEHERVKAEAMTGYDEAEMKSSFWSHHRWRCHAFWLMGLPEQLRLHWDIWGAALDIWTVPLGSVAWGPDQSNTGQNISIFSDSQYVLGILDTILNHQYSIPDLSVKTNWDLVCQLIVAVGSRTKEEIQSFHIHLHQDLQDDIPLLEKYHRMGNAVADYHASKYLENENPHLLKIPRAIFDHVNFYSALWKDFIKISPWWPANSRHFQKKQPNVSVVFNVPFMSWESVFIGYICPGKDPFKALGIFGIVDFKSLLKQWSFPKK